MKIGIVGPIDKPISLSAAGGTEVWTANFANTLTDHSYDVTVFGTAESEVKGELVKSCSVKDILLPDGTVSKQKFSHYSVQEMVDVINRQEDFDLIHISVYSLYHYLPLTTLIKKPVVITIHGSPFSKEDALPMVERYNLPHYVFISQSFADRWAKPANSSVIYNGIPTIQFPFVSNSDDYFFWIGRISHEKGTAEAIDFAIKANVRLKIVGNIQDRKYFEEKVKPRIGGNIELVESHSPSEKAELYGKAKAFLMPINWEEPFGLVAVEAMAAGTPVIAYGRGALPEIVVDGETGFIISPDDNNGFIEKIGTMAKMDDTKYKEMRQSCRDRVESLFTIEKMAKQYEDLYNKLI